MKRPVSILIFLITALFALHCRAEIQGEGSQTPIKVDSVQPGKYPRIVLYSVSWCPHCQEAKEYLTTHNIPFINKDVELDDNARTELLEKYKSTGVPVIVLGNDEKVMKGFNRENFEKVLNKMTQKGAQ